jgi:hypothetical protein
VLREHAGLTLFLRPLIPPRSWTVAFEALNSGMADALGFRTGLPLSDHNRSSMGDPYHQLLASLRQGSAMQIVAELEQRVFEFGYVRNHVGDRPGDDAPGQDVVRRFTGPDSMPHIFFAVRAPGRDCPGLDGFLVPERWVCVEAALTKGMTGRVDGVVRGKRPNAATRARMSELGVDISAPAWWRFWVWWFALAWKRARLSLLALRLGLLRGEILAIWKVGGEFLSPTTHGVLTIRAGSREDVLADLYAHRAAQRLIRAADGGHGTSVIPSGRTPRLSVAVYGPGDQIGVDGTMVPTGSVGLAITLTMGRTRYRAHESS